MLPFDFWPNIYDAMLCAVFMLNVMHDFDDEMFTSMRLTHGSSNLPSSIAKRARCRLCNKDAVNLFICLYLHSYKFAMCKLGSVIHVTCLTLLVSHSSHI